MSKIYVHKLDDNAVVPTRGSEKSAGLDLYSCESLTIPAWETAKVRTGISMAIPDGTYLRIAPRSGLAVKNRITTFAGVVDGDYRGEIVVVLANFNNKEFHINTGDRVAQGILEVYQHATVEEVEDLAETDRGAGGFGSTGR